MMALTIQAAIVVPVKCTLASIVIDWRPLGFHSFSATCICEYAEISVFKEGKDFFLVVV